MAQSPQLRYGKDPYKFLSQLRYGKDPYKFLIQVQQSQHLNNFSNLSVRWQPQQSQHLSVRRQPQNLSVRW